MARAAEQLGVNPPVVALHVRELEHELDAILFDRRGGGVTLTAAGERFHALAAPLVNGMDALLQDFAARVEGDVTGPLEVGASVAGAAIVLPPYVKRLRERYPGVWAAGEGIRRSAKGWHFCTQAEVEFVLGAREPLEGYALEYHEMLRYDIVLITSRDHPLAGRETVAPKEAAKWPAIVPPAGSYSRQFGETAAREFGFDIKAVLQIGGWGVIKRYVERGIGICVVPSICLHETDQVSVIRLEEHFRARSFGVYTRRGKALSAPARGLAWAVDTGNCATVADRDRRDADRRGSAFHRIYFMR